MLVIRSPRSQRSDSHALHRLSPVNTCRGGLCAARLADPTGSGRAAGVVRLGTGSLCQPTLRTAVPLTKRVISGSSRPGSRTRSGPDRPAPPRPPDGRALARYSADRPPAICPTPQRSATGHGDEPRDRPGHPTPHITGPTHTGGHVRCGGQLKCDVIYQWW